MNIKLLLLIISFTVTLVGSQMPLDSKETKNSGNTAVIQLLLQAGSNNQRVTSELDVNAQDAKGRTALFIAVQENQVDKIKELLQIKNIDISKADNDGMTPLQAAIDKQNVEAVYALLIAGDKQDSLSKIINKKDTKLGLTPLARAAQTGNSAIIKLLLEYDANPTMPVKLDNQMVRSSKLYAGNSSEIISLLKEKEAEVDERTNAFIKALTGHSIVQAKKMVALGIATDYKDEEGNTLLYHAIFSGCKDIVQELISHGYDVTLLNQDNQMSVMWALTMDRSDISDLLIKNGATITPLHETFSCLNTKKVIEKLIEYKADVNAVDEAGDTPMHYAALGCQKGTITLLVNAKANINALNNNGCSPLVYAASQEDNLSAVMELIKNKADINAEDTTPLYYAVSQGDKDVVQELITFGASIDDSLILLAAQKGNKDIVDILITFGADVNVKNQFGNTPLHIAAAYGHEPIVCLLLMHNADAKVKNQQNMTPTDMASQPELIKLLRKYSRG